MKQLIQRCGVFLMILLLISGVLSSCGAEEGIKVEFAEPAPPSSSGTDEITSIAPAPGHIVIGQISSVFSGSISEDLLSSYCIAEGATVEIIEYQSDKEMMDAAKAGEVDVLYGNNLIAYLLAYQDLLVDLEPYLSSVLETEEYYHNIFEAGRVNGKLVIACPNFLIGNALGVPQKAIEAFGRDPNDFQEIMQLYESFEKEYRAATAMIYDSRYTLDCALKLETHQYDITPYWDEWTQFLSLQKQDASGNRLYDEANAHVYPALLSGMEGAYFADPTMLYDYYRLLSGESYTKFGSQATIIPFSFADGEGFTIEGGTYCIPQTAPNPEAALHFVEWIISPDGQESSMLENCYCPILRSEAQKWFLRHRDHSENMYSIEDQQNIAEKYIKKADRFPVFSNILWQSCEKLLTIMGNRQLREENIATITSTEIIPELGGEAYVEKMQILATGFEPVIDYGNEKMAHCNEEALFYQDNAMREWPGILNEFIQTYITDLGYEMH